jgi:F-type H+-transporting ATPase subunit delta
MATRASAARYARALFDVALKEGKLEQAERDLAAFADLMASSPDLQKALTNPAVPVTGKKGITDAFVTRLKIVPPAGKLLLLLAERDRLSLVPDLLALYRDRLMEHQQVVRAEVTTAAPLEAGRAEQIQQRLARITGRQVDVSTNVDPAIIGGVVARIGGTVYDGSVATQLVRMRDRLEKQT